jgi:MFS family permease
MVFQPSFGRLCSLFPLKLVFYFSNALLVIGSIIGATAPTSEVLIVGRAVQGWGGAGIFASTLTLYSFVVSKKQMPLFVSVLGSIYIVASILGPVIGGVFAGSYLTWRFCFWINLREWYIFMLGVQPIGWCFYAFALSGHQLTLLSTSSPCRCFGRVDVLCHAGAEARLGRPDPPREAHQA